MRLREWAAKWLVGAAAYLIDSFCSPIRFTPTRFTEVSVSFLLRDDLYGAINLSPFAVVSLGLRCPS